MRLYEIDQRIIDLIDPETGEITDYESLEALGMERTEKLENLCCWYKDMVADAQKIHEEINNLQEREQRLNTRADHLKTYLASVLDGERFTTAKVDVKWRSTSRVEVDPQFVNWAKMEADELLTYKEPTPNKKAIGDALKSGTELPFARIEKNKSMSIK